MMKETIWTWMFKIQTWKTKSNRRVIKLMKRSSRKLKESKTWTINLTMITTMRMNKLNKKKMYRLKSLMKQMIYLKFQGHSHPMAIMENTKLKDKKANWTISCNCH